MSSAKQVLRVKYIVVLLLVVCAAAVLISKGFYTRQTTTPVEVTVCKDESCIISMDDKKDYDAFSFTAAGHIYGNPWGDNAGIYRPFRHFIKQNKYGAFVLLLGDSVRLGDMPIVKKVYRELGNLGVPYRITPGNHELTHGGIEHLKEVLNYRKMFYSWDYKNWHFISMDSNQLKNAAQLEFLKQDLAALDDSVEGVVLYTHHILWYDDFEVLPNNPPKQDSVDVFYDEVIPQLEGVERPVIVFGGDVGADSRVKDLEGLYVHGRQNITFVAVGMGAGQATDTVARVHITHDKGGPKIAIEKTMLNQFYSYPGEAHLH